VAVLFCRGSFQPRDGLQVSHGSLAGRCCHQGSPRILEWVVYPSREDVPDPGIESGFSCWWILYQLSYHPRVSVKKEPGQARGKESGVWQPRAHAAPPDAQPRPRGSLQASWTVLVLQLPHPKRNAPAFGPELAPVMHERSLRMLVTPSGWRRAAHGSRPGSQKRCENRPECGEQVQCHWSGADTG
ncbi:unnamed protein product, partial [Rangifer tarandus platyrhynchus]